MNKTLTGEPAARLTANSQLLQAYRCVREAAQHLDNYISGEAPSPESGKTVWRIFHELDGVLPAFWSNLAELIVADINCKLTGENER
ncbi:hypothetical protein KML24003_21180 [Alistipes finegoldii]|jgi:hypothetical protein|uniref:Uncharacterized protein n=1 Tax=Alistipes finegoldii TaxID=214856 RepID=A0AAE4RX78_9BACT|nr:hypothetical protein [Alistipes finegoldii]MCG4956870.1 hypothetical protein [Alistipes finegoldii]MDU0260338.1 hypothetical protein [Alistipes finegoldii]